MPDRGFFASLFDISFSSLVTTRIIRAIYVLIIVTLTLVALLFVALAFRASTVLGILVLLIGAPLWWLVTLVYSRIFFEFVIALFRIMETNVELVDLTRRQLELPAAEAPGQVSYQVGDVVNGHRFDGTDWVPVEPA